MAFIVHFGGFVNLALDLWTLHCLGGLINQVSDVGNQFDFKDEAQWLNEMEK